MAKQRRNRGSAGTAVWTYSVAGGIGSYIMTQKLMLALLAAAVIIIVFKVKNK